MALSKADEAAFTAIQENYSQVGTNPKDTAEVTKSVIPAKALARKRWWMGAGHWLRAHFGLKWLGRLLLFLMPYGLDWIKPEQKSRLALLAVITANWIFYMFWQLMVLLLIVEVPFAVIGGFFALVRGWLSSGGALDTEGTQ
jgi:hypothetical protein